MKFRNYISSNAYPQTKQLRNRWMLWVLIIFCNSLVSCESFVEVELPDSQIFGETVFSDPLTANAALSHIYAELRDNTLVTGTSRGISNLLGLYADEMEYYSSSRLAEEEFFLNNLLASNSSVATIWNGSYNLIFAANSVLEGVNNSTSLTKEERDQLRGEALFLRAYIHFYLTNLFGAIPYLTSTDYRENAVANKLPVSQVNQLIILDLIEAKEALPAQYLNERISPNKWVATALLSRVYLYDDNWEAAETEASLLINNNSVFQLEQDLNLVFLRNSPGTIWSLQPGVDGANTHEAQTFIFVSGPPPNRALSQDLVNAFEPQDMRFQYWVDNVENEDGKWFYPFKYKERTNTGSSLEYSILFRLAEQYLIRSEARAMMGNLTGAKEDLNIIRNRAGLEDFVGDSQDAILEAILEERRLELFSELGHRWFDLKRTGRANPVLEAVKPGWDNTDVLFPIPEKELLLNPNLEPQNPGY